MSSRSSRTARGPTIPTLRSLASRLPNRDVPLRMLCEPAQYVTILAIIRGVLENLCYSELRYLQLEEGLAACDMELGPPPAAERKSPSRKKMANSFALSLAPSNPCGAASIPIPRVSSPDYQPFDQDA